MELTRRSFIATAAASALVASAGIAVADEAAGLDYDIVVVGMGGAGMCAAISAKEAGAERVAILDRQPICGGCTSFSSSGMNAAYTEYQEAAGIEDSVDLFISDTMIGGHNMNNLELVTMMCEGSADGIYWLRDHGIELSDVTTMGGASVPRCHRPADKSAVGSFIVPLLEQATMDAGVDIYMETRAIELVKDEDGKVCGVVTEDGRTFNAGAVILCSGGFGANFDMIGIYRPDLIDYVTTNAVGTQGDGQVMAQAAGANLVHMDQIQIHPTVYSETGALIGEAVRGAGAIIVNLEGKRFVNEMATRDVVSAAELQQTDGKTWVLLDKALYDATPVVAKYEARGMTISDETLEALCGQLGIDAVACQETVDAYNAAVEAEGEGDEFGRTTGLGTLTTGPWYAIPVAPGIHHCMGGVFVDADAQALTIKREKVAGLFAAGEVTGGIHGSNRLGGNAVCDIVVNGIKAGRKAVESLM